MRQRRTTADDAAIGRTLRVLRLDRGLSQSDLGRAAGVSFQQLQKYENGATASRPRASPASPPRSTCR